MLAVLKEDILKGLLLILQCRFLCDLSISLILQCRFFCYLYVMFLISRMQQGSAADVAMCAMLEISNNEHLKELGWRLLLQVSSNFFSFIKEL